MSAYQHLERAGDTLRARVTLNGRAKVTLMVWTREPEAIIMPPDELRIEAEGERTRIATKAPEAKQDELRALLDLLAVDALGARAAGDAETKDGPFPPIEPWPESVSLAPLLDELVELLHRHVLLPPDAARAVALWVVHTYCLDATDFTPYVWIWSATRECGKSTLLDLLQKLSYRAIAASNVSPPAMFRVIEDYRPTVLLDEIDSFLKSGSEKADDVKNLLNAGFKRGTPVMRCETVKDVIRPRTYEVFSPKVICGIGKGLPDTTLSRTIPVRLSKATPAQLRHIERPRDRVLRATCEPMQRRLTRWAADHVSDLESATPEIPEELAGRPADIWAPLLAIAEMASGAWAEQARAAALSLAKGGTLNEDPGILLLADIYRWFEENPGVERVKSLELAEWLREQEHRPWPGWRGVGIKEHQIARLLSVFGEKDLKPKLLRFPDKSARGYERVAFSKLWETYPPADEGGNGRVTDQVTGLESQPVTSQPQQPHQLQKDVTGVTPRPSSTHGKRNPPEFF